MLYSSSYKRPLGKRTRNIFDPSSKEPFKLSRSKIENFSRCPRCFYLDVRCGIGQPPGPPFSLNTAVDHLLKKEFDLHREHKTPHPLMKSYGVDAIPFHHDRLNDWRENFVGVQAVHQPTNFLVTGAVDDIWVNLKGELIVVDYKATAKDGEVNLDAQWQESYKRQMEIYQWLLRQNGFTVSNTGYFVYVNGKKDAKAFDAKLEFDVKLISYTGSDRWIGQTLLAARACLLNDTFPLINDNCEYCQYRKAAYEKEYALPVLPLKKGKKQHRTVSAQSTLL